MTCANWDQALIARAQSLKNEGLSGYAIAKKLGRGLSRSAVIAKLRRIEMKILGKKEIHKRRKNMKVIQAVTRDFDPHALPPDPVALNDIGANQCRWVHGEAARGGVFCGLPTRQGFAWCAGHIAVVYSKKQPALYKGKLNAPAS